MMQHIDVGTVLRQAVACDLYSNLVTRPTGAAVRTQIEALLEEVRERSVAVIDFTHVRMIDFSCADEVVAKLLLPYCETTPPRDAYFLFRGVGEHHWDAIEAVLERHDLALLLEDETGLQLRGSIPGEERTAWETIHELGCCGPHVVAEVLGGDVERARAVLDSLSRRRLVMRLDDGYCVVGVNHGRFYQ